MRHLVLAFLFAAVAVVAPAGYAQDGKKVQKFCPVMTQDEIGKGRHGERAASQLALQLRTDVSPASQNQRHVSRVRRFRGQTGAGTGPVSSAEANPGRPAAQGGASGPVLLAWT